jgi:cytochrome c553
MKKLLIFGVVLGAMSIAACTNLERSRTLGNPAVSAKVLAEQICSNCHGLSGNAISPNFPNLAGQTEAYLTAQLTEFKGHSRSDPAGFEYMWGLSRHLTADQIEGLAKYYAAQKHVPVAIKVDQMRADTGKLIVEQGLPDQSIPPCMSCHGPQAMGNAIFPRLAGQHRDYLIKQLLVFQRTDERPEGSIMKTVAHGLTRQNMLDATEYLQSIQTP